MVRLDKRKKIFNTPMTKSKVVTECNDEDFIREQIKKMISDKKMSMLLSDIPNNLTDPLIYIYICTCEILQNSNLDLVEKLDEYVKKVNFSSSIDGVLMLEILKNLDMGLKEGVLKYNTKVLVPFLIKLMYKKTKLELGIKMFAYEIVKKFDKSCFEEMLIYDLPYISNFKEIKVKFLLDYFYNNKISPVDGKETNIFYLIFKDNRISKFEKIIRKCISTENLEFIYSFIDYYLENCQSDDIENGISILFEIFDFILSHINHFKIIHNEDTSKNLEIEKKYIKLVFNYFLNIMTVKTNKKRYRIANFLLRINLKNIVFNKKKVFKICKKLLKDNSIRIFEVAICILSIFNDEYLIGLMENTGDGDQLRVIFKYLKNIDNAIVYKKFLEVKNAPNTRDINIKINDIGLFSKIFYNFYNKEVAQYLEFNDLEVYDIYTLDLILHYSKYFPDKINEDYIASLILDDDTNILRNIKIIEILTNVHYNIQSSLKNNLLEKFKKLVLQNPYTKSIGQYLYKNSFYNIGMPKSDYKLVIMGSCNHPDYLKYFNEFCWSVNKERSLIYILQYKPELAIIYKHKLDEILLRFSENSSDQKKVDTNNLIYKYNLLEFLNLLTNILDQEYEDKIINFYFKFIMSHKNILYNFLKSKDLSIKIQSYKLILKCTNNKILIKEESVPQLVVYYKYDNNLIIYKDVLAHNILNILNDRIIEYKKYKKVYDEYFIQNITKVTKIDTSKLINSLLDGNETEDIYLRFYILYLNTDINKLEDNLFLEDNEILLYFRRKLCGNRLANINDVFSIKDKETIYRLKLSK
jgi:hypothetical protein